MRQRVSSQWLGQQKRGHSGAHQGADSPVHPGISGTAVVGDHREPACNARGRRHADETPLRRGQARALRQRSEYERAYRVLLGRGTELRIAYSGSFPAWEAASLIRDLAFPRRNAPFAPPPLFLFPRKRDGNVTVAPRGNSLRGASGALSRSGEKNRPLSPRAADWFHKTPASASARH